MTTDISEDEASALIGEYLRNRDDGDWQLLSMRETMPIGEMAPVWEFEAATLIPGAFGERACPLS